MKKYKILYVDDEESNLRIFKNTFRREYQVFTAISAKEGIDILKNETIDIILSDQRMPKMTGVEFLKYTLNTHPELNRILITGYTDFSAIKSAINDAKIYQYVQKPWREDDLSQTIKEALNIYKLEKKNKKLTKHLKQSNEELTKTNEELQIAKEKAEESDRLKSVFFSNMSHEIRTPMNGIIGFSKFLINPHITKDQITEFAEIIIRSSEQLLQIIEDIIEISQLDTKQIKVNKSDICINIIINDLILIFEKISKEKNLPILFEAQYDDEQCIISTDKTKINKILSNLIDNALKYTEKGNIKISYEIQNDFIEMSVKDTGIGIKPEMLENIFDRFRQENEDFSDHFGGLGLGLAIVKENINLLKGEIKLVSKKGEGSTFTIKIPK